MVEILMINNNHWENSRSFVYNNMFVIISRQYWYRKYTHQYLSRVVFQWCAQIQPVFVVELKSTNGSVYFFYVNENILKLNPLNWKLFWLCHFPLAIIWNLRKICITIFNRIWNQQNIWTYLKKKSNTIYKKIRKNGIISAQWGLWRISSGIFECFEKRLVYYLSFEFFLLYRPGVIFYYLYN